MNDYQLILTETRDRVGIVTLNRPKAYNALNYQLLTEITEALEHFDRNKDIGAMVITGNQKAFAAGADITNMVDCSSEEIQNSPFIPAFEGILGIRKPVIAAVSGYCLGGGLELALACDLIIASETASFGQPEITLGIIPGAGGTQRLPRAIGKSLSMEMILNNRTLSATEALEQGLINAVHPVEDYLDRAQDLAQEIAHRAPLAIQAAKKAINLSFQGSLAEGLIVERDIFYALFDTKDQQEGMNAFLEKRKATWKGE
ncbi:MAG: enoyl-CoA hydratase [Chloroflexi bacterium]|nr:MAG: enoyl-CoA hydratase [Chloroflexota bacterium]